jgi:D-glycero-alpha-D-manno-heptose-7-phosphate kinase
MLIARAPVRLSFFGGGTDLPAYYLQQPGGGAVLSTTIDKYVYIILSVSERQGLQITSSDYHTFYRHPQGEPLLWDGDLSLPRAVLHHFGVEYGLAMFMASEVPPGTGLGSSSSVTVALVKAISTACGLRLSPRGVAELACKIEIGKLGKPIGVQDQYAAAFGGLNWMTFGPEGVTVEPLAVATAIRSFTGSAHDSVTILGQQARSTTTGDRVVMEALRGAYRLALEARDCLQTGDLERFGCLLHAAWQHKKRFASGITDGRIDMWYDLARSNGALGGKIAGAGGGGFLVLYCEDGAKDRVQRVLSGAGLRCLECGFESDGSRVLFNAGLRLPPAAFTGTTHDS